MPADPGLVARVADALAQLDERAVRQKNVFGGRGFLRGSRTFAIVWHDDLLIKLPPGEATEALRQSGVTPFAPDGENPSRNWVIVSADTVADDPELVDWLRRALRSL